MYGNGVNNCQREGVCGVCVCTLCTLEFNFDVYLALMIINNLLVDLFPLCIHTILAKCSVRLSVNK